MSQIDSLCSYLKMSFSPLHKIKEQKDGTGPAGGGEKEK
jgi:hypothetical protein